MKTKTSAATVVSVPAIMAHDGEAKTLRDRCSKPGMMEKQPSLDFLKSI